MWEIIILIEAQDEILALPPRDQAAISDALLKLKVFGDRLGAPHSSAVKGANTYLRELRPTKGASPWRPLYRRVGEAIVVGAIAPEAVKNRRGFNRAVTEAIARLEHYMEEEELS